MSSGAPLYAVASRWRAGETLQSIARDFEIPTAEIEEVIHGVYLAAA